MIKIRHTLTRFCEGPDSVGHSFHTVQALILLCCAKHRHGWKTHEKQCELHSSDNYLEKTHTLKKQLKHKNQFKVCIFFIINIFQFPLSRGPLDRTSCTTQRTALWGVYIEIKSRIYFWIWGGKYHEFKMFVWNTSLGCLDWEGSCPFSSKYYIVTKYLTSPTDKIPFPVCLVCCCVLRIILFLKLLLCFIVGFKICNLLGLFEDFSLVC